MPIYAYRCGTCGRAKDVLQRMSDPVLSECPFCGAGTFVKQVTAAGFQLKGSGWYATDFRGDSKAPKAADGEASGDANRSDGKDGEGKTADGKGGDSKGGDGKGGDAAAAPKPAAKSDSGSSSAAPASSSSPASPPPAAGGAAGPSSK